MGGGGADWMGENGWVEVKVMCESVLQAARPRVDAVVDWARVHVMYPQGWRSMGVIPVVRLSSFCSTVKSKGTESKGQVGKAQARLGGIWPGSSPKSKPGSRLSRLRGPTLSQSLVLSCLADILLD